MEEEGAFRQILFSGGILLILSIFADPSNQLGILLLLSIFATTISSSDRHISFVQLRPSLRACFGHVARLFASVANAVKKSAATTAMSIPMATTTTSDLTLGVVDLMRAIVVAVVRLRAAAVLAKARLLLKTLEEEAGKMLRQSARWWLKPHALHSIFQ